MPKVLIRKWSEADREEMKQIAKVMLDVLHSSFKADIMKAANVIEVLHESFAQQAGMNKAIVLSEKKGIINTQKVRNILKIIEGMQESDVNLVLFRDESEVLMQLHMGFYLRLKTYIIAQSEHKTLLDDLRLKYPLIRGIEYVDEFNQVNLKAAMGKLSPKMQDSKY